MTAFLQQGSTVSSAPDGCVRVTGKLPLSFGSPRTRQIDRMQPLGICIRVMLGRKQLAWVPLRPDSIQSNGRVELPGPADLDHVEVAGERWLKRLVGGVIQHDASYRIVDGGYAAGEYKRD